MTADLPPPPEPPPVLSQDEVVTSKLVRVPLASWRWHRLRDAYANQQATYIDQLASRYELAQADLEDVRLDLSVADGVAVAAEARADALDVVLARRPKWGTVVTAGAVGVAVGGLGAAWLLVSRPE